MIPELISYRKWPPGIETVIPRVIQSNRSYHGITDQFNVLNGSISNVMKLFIASGGVMHRFATKKLQIAFGCQKRPLNQTRSSSKRIYRRKTWFQPGLPPPKEGYRMLVHIYACDPAKKYWIQEKNPICLFYHKYMVSWIFF
jgi:hypothetical protein